MRRLPLIAHSSPIRRLRWQRRFVSESLVILVPHNDYYVQGECARALSALGHRVVRVAIGAKGENVEHGEVLRRLLQAVVAHRPDMLLTVNYTGFDRLGFFDEIIEAMGLPTAVWFVDSPFFLAEGFLPPAPTMVSGFVWDRSYLEVLRAHGMTDVTHLPLATCRHQIATSEAAPVVPPLPISFVGHSLATIETIWSQLCGPPEQARAAGIEAQLLRCRQHLHKEMGHIGPPVDVAIRALALGNYRASRALRAKLLQRIEGSDLHVFGDEAWQQALPRANLHGGCTYGTETARIFRHSAINVNITNFQMPETVNQRVFDVPGAGAFLLTDRQSELSDYYQDGVEVATFASPEELADKAHFFGRKPDARAAIVKRGRQRTLSEHTYEHRMQTLLGCMRHKHGQQSSAVKDAPACASPPPMS